MHISPGEYWLYLQYMALAVAMVFAFAAVYLHCTPPAELRLIREEGNVACALSFGGALVGFCLALAASIPAERAGAGFCVVGAGRRRGADSGLFCRDPFCEGCERRARPQ